MTTIRVNTRDLNADFLESLKVKFPESDLEILIDESLYKESFTEQDFWKVIDQLNWNEEGDDEGVLRPAVAFLSGYALSGIYRFADLLAEKLWRLDTAEHAQVFLEEEGMNGHLSVDDFLYARCCVVANGRETYERVLSDPSNMPLDVTFEPLLRLASDAYRLKTGKDTLMVTAYSYETYSNKAGWGKKE